MSELVRRRRQGELGRDAYWAELAERHLELRDYGNLLRGSVADRIVVERDRVLLELRDGTRWTWPPGDLRAPPVVVLNDGEYEPVELRVLSALMPEGGVALDVGANLGWYSVHLARKGGGAAVVHAFEPIAATFAVLQENLILNNLDGTIIPHRLALGEAAGMVEFYTPQVTGSVASSQRPLLPGEPQSIETCEVQTLDHFVHAQSVTRLALVKCDVEGGELAFLKGAMATLASQRPVLMVELLRKWSAVYGYEPNAAVALLAGLDYRCHVIDGGKLVDVARIAEDSPQTNFFFVPAERARDAVARAAEAGPG